MDGRPDDCTHYFSKLIPIFFPGWCVLCVRRRLQRKNQRPITRLSLVIISFLSLSLFSLRCCACVTVHAVHLSFSVCQDDGFEESDHPGYMNQSLNILDNFKEKVCNVLRLPVCLIVFLSFGRRFRTWPRRSMRSLSRPANPSWRPSSRAKLLFHWNIVGGLEAFLDGDGWKYGWPLEVVSCSRCMQQFASMFDAMSTNPGKWSLSIRYQGPFAILVQPQNVWLAVWVPGRWNCRWPSGACLILTKCQLGQSLFCFKKEKEFMYK